MSAWLWLLILTPLLLACAVYAVSLFVIERPPPLPLANQHALITGGSSGVGLSTALLLVARGVHVSLLARDPARLRAAEERVLGAARKSAAGARVLAVSCDVCDAEATAAAIARCEASLGAVSIFVHCAGSSTPGYFEELPPSVHEAQFRLHYMGAVHCLHVLVPRMKRLRAGRVVLVASMGALSGVFGYTAYSASKFALRALAESLHMETAPYGTFVSLICPPDIDTPGFAAENRLKPVECAEISEGSGLFSPEAIGRDIVHVLQRWRFLSSVGFDGHALTLLASGTSPASSAATLTLEFFVMGPLRVISAVYRKLYSNIVLRAKRRREAGHLRPIGKQA